LEGERGDEAGEEREEVRRLRRAGEREGREVGWSAPSTVSSSGRGPRVEWEEEAEEIPDMAETLCLSCSCCVRLFTREFWMAA